MHMFAAVKLVLSYAEDQAGELPLIVQILMLVIYAVYVLHTLLQAV